MAMRDTVSMIRLHHIITVESYSSINYLPDQFPIVLAKVSSYHVSSVVVLYRTQAHSQ